LSSLADTWRSTNSTSRVSQSSPRQPDAECASTAENRAKSRSQLTFGAKEKSPRTRRGLFS
jgi:hypothetical protein